MKVWAYIAHKDGYWAGIASPELSDIGRWIGKFIRDGFTVSSTKDEAEYAAALDSLKPWHESPEYRAKHSRKRKSKAASPTPPALPERP